MNIKVLLKRLDVLEQKVSNLEDENTLTKRFINFTKAATVFFKCKLVSYGSTATLPTHLAQFAPRIFQGAQTLILVV